MKSLSLAAGETMSLSNLIKPDFYVALDDTKTVDNLQQLLLRARVDLKARQEQEEEAAVRQQELDKLYGMKDQILKDAEELAEAQIRDAMEEAAGIRAQADDEIRDWWEAKRQEDEEIIRLAREDAQSEGLRIGTDQAHAQVREEYGSMIEEARSVLEQSYRLKREIIQEAEPFLIELSTAIAEKIIRHQLTISPDWIMEMTCSVLSRKRGKGLITLCVAPKNFSYFQDARDEFLLAVDSQAELQIVPDNSVIDDGCVIRTEFGSVDARIDTQLNEIKNALQQIAIADEDEADE